MNSPSRFFSSRVLTALAVAAAVLVCRPADAGAKPGAEQVLARKTAEATLYVTEVHRQPDGRTDVSLVWIPADILPRCLGKPAADCRKIDNCTLFPTAQKCTPDLSHCDKIVRPECAPLGFSLADEERRRNPEHIPHRVLVHMPYKQAQEFAALLSRRGVPLDFQGKREFAIEPKYELKAEVQWELWSNGENFSVLRLLSSE